MASKAKVRSMQRGAATRDREYVSARELYDQSPPKLTKPELSHFQFGDRVFDDFFESISPRLAAASASGLTASQVSNVLNKAKIKTARGEEWTPRLAWFLMSVWRKVGKSQLKSSGKNDQQSHLDRDVERLRVSRLKDEMRKEFHLPTWADAFPDLLALKSRLEGERS